MKRVIFIFWIACTRILPGQELQISLSQAYDMAMGQRPAALVPGLLRESAGARQEALGTAYMPQLSLAGRATYQTDVISIPELFPGMPGFEISNDQYRATLDVQQLLWDGGRVKAAQNLIRTEAETTIAEQEVTLQGVRKQVNQAVISQYLVQAQMESLRTIKQTLLARKKQLQSAFENGIVPSAELDRIEVEILQITQQLRSLEGNRQAARRSLNHLLGLPDSARVIVRADFSEIPESAGYAGRAEQQVFTNRLHFLDAQSDLSQKSRYPKVAAFVQSGYGRPGLNLLDDSFQPWAVAGVTFSWQLWDWGKSRKEAQAIALQKEVVRQQQLDFEHNLETARVSLLARMDALKNNLATDDSIIQLQQNIRQSETERLEQGISLTADYIAAVQAEKKARLQKNLHEAQLMELQLEYLNLLGLPKIN